MRRRERRIPLRALASWYPAVKVTSSATRKTAKNAPDPYRMVLVRGVGSEAGESDRPAYENEGDGGRGDPANEQDALFAAVQLEERPFSGRRRWLWLFGHAAQGYRRHRSWSARITATSSAGGCRWCGLRQASLANTWPIIAA